MRRLTLAFGIAVIGAALAAQGLAEARGGRSGGSRAGGWHSGGSYSGSWHSGGSRSGRSHAGSAHFGSGHGGRFGHRTRLSGGFLVAAPLYGTGYALVPYYSGLATAPSEPVYYIEKSDGYWYYCTEAGRYYPEVEQCSSAWVSVQAWSASPSQ